MAERSRLLLLIALGETVLGIGIGTGLTEATVTPAVVLAALAALVATSMLWFLYFVDADLSIQGALRREDGGALGRARTVINAQLVVLAGLIATAVGFEAVIEAPSAPLELPTAAALHLGVALYLLAQTGLLRALTDGWSRTRSVSAVLLLAAAPLATTAPALVDLAVVCVVLVLLVLVLRWRRPRAGDRALD